MWLSSEADTRLSTQVSSLQETIPQISTHNTAFENGIPRSEPFLTWHFLSLCPFSKPQTCGLRPATPAHHLENDLLALLIVRLLAHLHTYAWSLYCGFPQIVHRKIRQTVKELRSPL